jgi:hypothetical protein
VEYVLGTVLVVMILSLVVYRIGITPYLPEYEFAERVEDEEALEQMAEQYQYEKSFG